MSSSVGNTIQQLLNNSPVDVSVGDKVTVVSTAGGNVYHTGFVDNQIHSSFSDSISNIAQIGHVQSVVAANDRFYLLNAAGSVFEYDYNLGGCEYAREVYNSAYCHGDKAVEMAAGDNHVLIRTECKKVYGVGDNSQYQLVPQGQCRYDTATEILITDTIMHDPACCDTFSGILEEMNTPVLPGRCNSNQLACIKDLKCDVHLGYMNLDGASLDGCSGILSIPLFGDVSYNGVLCVDPKGCVTGQVTYSLTRLAIRCGSFDAKFTRKEGNKCHIREFTLCSTKEITIFHAEPLGCRPKTLCDLDAPEPITGTTQVAGSCGDCSTMNIVLPSGMPIPGAEYDGEEHIILALGGCRTSLSGVCDTTLTGLQPDYDTVVDLDTEIYLDCSAPIVQEAPALPQPSWKMIAAGGDVSVLVDTCERIYALGSLHTVRSNKTIARDNRVENLLNNTKARVTFSADQLNCNRDKRDDCGCDDTPAPQIHTDLSKFNVQLDFPDSNMSICDFLERLKLVNQNPACGPTCEPCDRYVYLNIAGECSACSSAPAVGDIGSIAIYNKHSITKAASVGCPSICELKADLNTSVEFNLNSFCVENRDIPLDKVLHLDFCNDGPHVNVVVDTAQMGGIRFTADSPQCNIEFPVQAVTPTRQYLLNYGTVLDPVLLTNLKHVLCLDEHYPSAKYKNPFNTKITNTYLRGGDHVKFVLGNYKNIRHSVTADVPTVFRLNNRVIDVAVGEDNLSVLVGGMNCPNEVMAIGYNCGGQLGLGHRMSTTVFKVVDRCLFDCQVIKVWAGADATFYLTQSHAVYAAGYWRDWISSSNPTKLDYVCPSWKIKKIALARHHAVMIGEEGCIFGLGRNNVGELGLRHVECVEKPIPLSFFYELNGHVAGKLRDGLSNPMPQYHAPQPSYGHGGQQGGCPFKIPTLPQFPQMPDQECKYAPAAPEPSFPHFDKHGHDGGHAAAPRARVAGRYNPHAYRAQRRGY